MHLDPGGGLTLGLAMVCKGVAGVSGMIGGVERGGGVCQGWLGQLNIVGAPLCPQWHHGGSFDALQCVLGAFLSALWCGDVPCTIWNVYGMCGGRGLMLHAMVTFSDPLHNLACST
jgi:hypothetical protein